jgi:hypothetical protein
MAATHYTGGPAGVRTAIAFKTAPCGIGDAYHRARLAGPPGPMCWRLQNAGLG